MNKEQFKTFKFFGRSCQCFAKKFRILQDEKRNRQLNMQKLFSPTFTERNWLIILVINCGTFLQAKAFSLKRNVKVLDIC